MSIHRSLMMRRYGLEHSTFLYSGVVFDPILTPIFTSWFAAAGLSAGAAATAGSIATAIATTALTIGLQLALAPKPPTPEAARVPMKQAIPYRIWGVGRTRLAGAFMLWESKKHLLYAVQAMAGHRIKSYNRYWLHDDEVNVNATTGLATAADGSSRYGNQNVYIYKRLGTAGQTAYAEIVSAFAGDADPIWTSNHIGVGQASLGMVAGATRIKDQNKVFPYGVPQLSAEADLAYCWDFRDPAQSPTNPATWTWTQNCALILCWHLCFNEFGFGLDYTKAILPVLDMWKEEADICDEAVPLAGGGTEPRYQCNGTDTTENSPKAALNAMLAACDGHLVARGDGARILTVGKFRESRCVTLTDADIIGHNIQYGVFPQDEINRIIPKFTYPDTGYTTCDADYFEDVPAQLTAGRVLAQDGIYQWVHRWRQARRLAIRDWRRIQEKVKGSIDIRLSGINAVYARWVRLETPIRMPRLNGKIIENRKSTLALASGGFNMEIMQHPANIDSWVPATDEGTQPPVPVPPGYDGIPTPVINLVQAKPNGSSVYIRVVLVDPANDSLTPVVRYRVVDTDGLGTVGAWVEQSFPDANAAAGYINLNTNVVPNDKLLDVQAAYRSSGGSMSSWSITANVTSTVDPVAPAALTSFTQTAAGPRLGHAIFSLTTPNDSHVKTVKLYRKASGSGINVVTDTPIATLNVGALGTYGYTDGDASRTNMVPNGDFSSGASWLTSGGGWSISAGKAVHAAGSAGNIYQLGYSFTGGVYRYSFTLSSVTAGGTALYIMAPSVGSPTRTTNGTQLGTLTPNVAATEIGMTCASTFAGSVDDVIVYPQTASCAPQGAWDYYAVPFNGSNVAGPASGPVSVTII